MIQSPLQSTHGVAIIIHLNTLSQLCPPMNSQIVPPVYRLVPTASWIISYSHLAAYQVIIAFIYLSVLNSSHYISNLYSFYTYIGMSQRFCNILVTWGSIQQLWMFLPRSWRWWTTLDCETKKLLYYLCVLLARFVSRAWRTALELMVLSLLELSWSSRILHLERNFSNHLVTPLSSAVSSFTQQTFRLLLCHSPF